MPVYLLRAGDTDRVKIGWAVSVAERIRVLQAGCWEPLRLLRTWAGGQPEEAWLHQQFAAHRVAREWFLFHPDMLIIEAPPPVEEPRAPGVFRDHFDIIHAFGGVASFCKAINIPPVKGGHYARRGIPAKYWPDVEVAAQDLAAPVAITAQLLRELSPMKTLAPSNGAKQ